MIIPRCTEPLIAISVLSFLYDKVAVTTTCHHANFSLTLVTSVTLKSSPTTWESPPLMLQCNCPSSFDSSTY